MDGELQDKLASMTDEDFFELLGNMEVSCRIRELTRGKNGYSQADIQKRLGLGLYDMLNAVNAAFAFTTRHTAIITSLEHEKEDLDELDELEEDDKENLMEIHDDTSDIPDALNYSNDTPKEETMAEIQARVQKDYELKKSKEHLSNTDPLDELFPGL